MCIELIVMQVLVGRCGSGRNKDCPGGTSHDILCCELDYATNTP